MAETLLALLLVTTSAKGSNLVFRWPENPTPSPRLCRPKPDTSMALSHLDNPWRASHSQEELEKAEVLPEHDYGRDPEYGWPRSSAVRDRSTSFSHSSQHNMSGRGSPSRDSSYSFEKLSSSDEYDHVLGYEAEFLAYILCPQKSLCHAKFELVIDDLAFIGHPVCAESDGSWRFKPEKIQPDARRDESEAGNSTTEEHRSADPASPASETSSGSKSAWLQTFHVVLVLDLPDPSSSSSGNLAKYFNILYEQIAFTLTAVLYQEQVLSNFVEKECDRLLALKENCISKGCSFSKYSTQALETSSIAPAMKTIYEAIKASDLAYVTINYLPLQLQLPPHVDALLHSQDDQRADFMDPSDDDSNLLWGQSMSLGWKLPTMAPWKTLVLLDDEGEMDPYTALRGPQNSAEDRQLAEGIVRFLETASINLPLFDMANILDWDLESQVYPIVRWLVLHRRAKIVDVVHSGLKTVFALPPKFDEPLAELSAKFKDAFPQSIIPPLPRLLATISASSSKQGENHFFASVVKSKELVRTYLDVVHWMLKRNMLITLHLRIRIIATHDLKTRVKNERELYMAQRSGIGGKTPRSHHERSESEWDESEKSPAGSAQQASFFLSPKEARRFARRISSNESGKSEISELDFIGAEAKQAMGYHNSEVDESDTGWDTMEDHLWPSVINDPGKATPMQRRWLAAMSDGKDPVIAKRFEQINQYFDGKKSDDEILYRAEISRKQLREVLHAYDEYLETFLHPS
ncbi:hypothetical protein BDN70DRAFT_796462 [Pholiota conissans]|uniref:Nitrogen permease regulator 3 n=1 Tax=Pholiota conissans TaxID=109636 RepID=A0A9P6D6T4_9AGAR|nr:hypothetical protein BDN70DRAFT_796462 [Pholiota conissans]